MADFSYLKHVHIIGVCGTLMGAFAAFLKRQGVLVTGSDQNIYPPMSDVLTNAGVKLYSGYNAKNLTQASTKPDIIVIGNVIRSDNPEARAAIDGGYQYTSLPEFMEKYLLAETRNLTVCGTHGKTTTSSLLAHTLNYCKKNPSYFIGGVSHDLPVSFHVSDIKPGSCFVLEGDEYDTAFWDKVPKFNHYRPTDVILTSVEYDHADIYPSFEAVIKAFDGLIDRIQSHGRLIACLDYPVMPKIIARAKVPVITYGSHEITKAEWIVKNIRAHGENLSFDIFKSDEKIESLELKIPGKHNALNALAVWLECRELGIPSEQIKKALAAFKGVKRRQEVRGEPNGITVIDDFAHHPTAVKETIAALKNKYAGRRLIAVFEPRSATSRRKVFQKDFAKAFGEADLVYIAKPYDQSRISEDDRFSSEQFIADLNKLKTKAFIIESADDGVKKVAETAQRGDVIAVLSNGGFDGFIQKLLDELK